MKTYLFTIVTTLFSITISAQEGTPDIIRGDESFTLLVKTEDIKTTKLINDVEVYLYETSSDKLLDRKTTKYGLAEFSIDPFTEYELRTCHNDYFRNGISIFECHEGNEVLCVTGASDYQYVAGGGADKPRAVLKTIIQLSSMNVGSIFELSNVYYDLDKASLRPSAKDELDELANILKRNESITIELSSHTDSRASDEYNMQLSKERAESCYQYLIDKGIDASRINPVGYGENRLRNECTNGVECTEAQHQKIGEPKSKSFPIPL